MINTAAATLEKKLEGNDIVLLSALLVQTEMLRAADSKTQNALNGVNTALSDIVTDSPNTLPHAIRIPPYNKQGHARTTLFAESGRALYRVDLFESQSGGMTLIAYDVTGTTPAEQLALSTESLRNPILSLNAVTDGDKTCFITSVSDNLIPVAEHGRAEFVGLHNEHLKALGTVEMVLKNGWLLEKHRSPHVNHEVMDEITTAISGEVNTELLMDIAKAVTEMYEYPAKCDTFDEPSADGRHRYTSLSSPQRQFKLEIMHDLERETARVIAHRLTEVGNEIAFKMFEAEVDLQNIGGMIISPYLAGRSLRRLLSESPEDMRNRMYVRLLEIGRAVIERDAVNEDGLFGHRLSQIRAGLAVLLHAPWIQEDEYTHFWVPRPRQKVQLPTGEEGFRTVVEHFKGERVGSDYWRLEIDEKLSATGSLGNKVIVRLIEKDAPDSVLEQESETVVYHRYIELKPQTGQLSVSDLLRYKRKVT